MGQKPDYLYLAASLMLILAGVLVGGLTGITIVSIGVMAYIFYTVLHFLLHKEHNGGLHNLQNLIVGGDSDAGLDSITRFAVLLYALLLFSGMVYYKISPVLDQIVFFGVLGLVFLGKFRNAGRFLWDWIPFALLIFSYDAMRGIADDLGGRVHYVELIEAEKFLFFGDLPTVWLQENLFTPGFVAWYDLLAALLYSLHFLLPGLFAYFLWIQDERKFFREFRATIVLLSYAALITFLLYPAAPPWLANEEGYIPLIHKILSEIDSGYFRITLGSLYAMVNANPVAAMPSLHAAYPWVIFLFALKYFGEKGIFFIILPLGINFSLVYLGEHYVVDLLMGIVYATAIYLLVTRKLSSYC